MTTPASREVVRKEAFWRELRGAVAFVMVLISVASLAGIAVLTFFVYSLTVKLEDSNKERHADTVNVITAAAYCARKPNIRTYNQMIVCITNVLDNKKA